MDGIQSAAVNLAACAHVDPLSIDRVAPVRPTVESESPNRAESMPVRG